MRPAPLVFTFIAIASACSLFTGCSTPPAVDGFPTWEQLEASPELLALPRRATERVAVSPEPTDLRYRLDAGMKLRAHVRSAMRIDVGAGVDDVSVATDPSETVTTKTWRYEVVEVDRNVGAKVRARLERIMISVGGRNGTIEPDGGPEMLIALSPEGHLALLAGGDPFREWASEARRQGEAALASSMLQSDDLGTVADILSSLADLDDERLAREHELIFPRLGGTVSPEARWQHRRTVDHTGTDGITMLDDYRYLGIVERADGVRLAKIVRHQRGKKVVKLDEDGDRTIVAPSLSAGAVRLVDPATGLLFESEPDELELIVAARTGGGDVIAFIRLLCSTSAAVARLD